jgi:hypothetical protein
MYRKEASGTVQMSTAAVCAAEFRATGTSFAAVWIDHENSLGCFMIRSSLSPLSLVLFAFRVVSLHA